MSEQTKRCTGRDDVVLLAYGEVSEKERGALLAHLDDCSACRARFAEIVAVRTGYARVSPPRLSAGDKEGLIERAIGGGSTERRAARSRRSRSPTGIAWRPLAAAAVVALAFLAGRITPTASGPATAERLAGIEAELAELRRDRLRMAVEHPSAIVRMQEIHAVDSDARESVTDLLLQVLERDPNPNVRLAALDALRQGELTEAEARIVLTRLLSEPSPLLRSALIDFVVDREIDGRRPLLERLERSDEDPTVRSKARAVLGRTT